MSLWMRARYGCNLFSLDEWLLLLLLLFVGILWSLKMEAECVVVGGIKKRVV